MAPENLVTGHKIYRTGDSENDFGCNERYKHKFLLNFFVKFSHFWKAHTKISSL